MYILHFPSLCNPDPLLILAASAAVLFDLNLSYAEFLAGNSYSTDCLDIFLTWFNVLFVSFNIILI